MRTRNPGTLLRTEQWEENAAGMSPAVHLAAQRGTFMPVARPEFARIRLAFGKSAYFRELPAATLDTLAAASTLTRCPGGLLHGPNEAADRFWLVLEGSLIVSWHNSASVCFFVGV